MSVVRQGLAALKILLVLTVLLGVAYPLLICGVGVLLPAQAQGSLIMAGGQVVGSSLIGQKATDPTWFWSRPSASDYSGKTSGGSNLSPTSAEEAKAIADRTAALLAANPDAVGPLPQDAVTASASGLDPDISAAYALWQVPRIAKARNLDADVVRKLVAAHTAEPILGFIGTEHVNVTDLNVALAAL
jgi:K+-transporting ATPase ATPase C chain